MDDLLHNLCNKNHVENSLSPIKRSYKYIKNMAALNILSKLTFWCDVKKKISWNPHIKKLSIKVPIKINGSHRGLKASVINIVSKGQLYKIQA